ncbi:MAG TPA: SDR family oxidoreductase [Thermoanaerobaculia bacterium]|nr:SDR family oxidoreductase [Thermoanaerobaculia bacterium]
MAVSLKNLSDQVLVITGASSGIGLTTAKMAAKKGAKVVLASRDEEALRKAVDEIRAEGGVAVHVVADVANLEDMHRVAHTAEREFGGFDTWVNNAGISIYGRILEVPVEDARRLFETNYWGVVNGSLVATPHLRKRGGALINLGSIVSDLAVPLQGHYSASKHAVKGFTDALRMELEEEGAPVSVTLVKPAAIDTPFPEHARSYLDEEPKLPPPVYAPDEVAHAILTCAEKPVRDVVVGGGGRMMTAMGTTAPRLADRYMEAAMFEQQRSDELAALDRPDALWGPMRGSGRERGDHQGHVMRMSAYTRAALNPGMAIVILSMLGLTLALATRPGLR